MNSYMNLPQNPYQARLDTITNPYNPQYNQPYQQQPLRQYDIIHVNGENGARAFRMLPNSRALLMDDTQPIVWLVQSDGAGYHTVTPFDITEHRQVEQKQNDFEERLKRLEAMIYGNKSADGASREQPQPNAGGNTTAPATGADAAADPWGS